MSTSKRQLTYIHISFFIVSLICVLGVGLRWYQIQSEAFYVEKTFIESTANYPLISMMQGWFEEAHFPTYFIVLRYWMKLFGPGTFSLTFLNAIFGSCTIYLLYLLGALLFNHRTGLIGAALFAVSTTNIFYSHYPKKPYSISVFFVVLSVLFLIKYFRTQSLKNLIVYFGAIVISLVLLPSVAPMIIVHLISAYSHCYLEKKRKHSVSYSIVIGLSLLCVGYILLLLYLLKQASGHEGITTMLWLKRPSLKTVIDVFSFFGIITFKEYKNLFLLMGMYTYCSGLFLMCCKGCYEVWIHHSVEEKTTVILWLALPIIIPFILSHLLGEQGFFGPVRYVLYISPIYYLLAARGITVIKKQGVQIMLAMIMVLAPLFFYKDYIYVDRWIPWKKIEHYITKNSAEPRILFSFHSNLRKIDDVFHFIGYNIDGIWAQELLPNSTDSMKYNIGRVSNRDADDSVGGGYLRNLNLYEINDIWLNKFCFISFNTKLDDKIISLLQQRYSISANKEFYGLTVYSFKKRNNSAI